MQFFKDSGTDAPEKIGLERYIGPALTEPTTISRYEEMLIIHLTKQKIGHQFLTKFLGPPPPPPPEFSSLGNQI